MEVMVAAAITFREDTFVDEITGVQDEIYLFAGGSGHIVSQHPRPGTVKPAFVVLAGGERYRDRRRGIGMGRSPRPAGDRAAAVFTQEAVIVGPGGFKLIDEDTQGVVTGLVRAERGLQHQAGKVRVLRDLQGQRNGIGGAVRFGAGPQHHGVRLGISRSNQW